VKTTLQTVLAAVFVALIVATPRLAAACAVCLGGTGGGTARAFAIGTALRSILPRAAIGAAFWYMRRRAKAIEHVENDRRARVVARSLASHG
jgi:hypothetical protein